jgi:N-acetylglucosamine-6-sulfatase
VLKEQTLQFIDDSVGAGKPFFAYVAPKAPHGPFRGTVPRHETDFDGATAPQSGSFNEEDVSDKPSWIQSLPSLTSDDIAAINNTYERRLESLQPVDDLVADVVVKLRDEGVLSNTYIVFTSDNGFYLGQHRIQRGKARPYEEAPHVPLVISGPGVQAGSTDELILNTDYFPTFMDLAGAPTPSYVDGRSLRPLLEKSATTTWRTAILIEGRGNRQDPEIPVDRNYNAIRTSTSKYVEYEGDIREYYNLSTDPYELQNSYDPNTPPTDLERTLQDLKGCAADTCRRAENGP